MSDTFTPNFIHIIRKYFICQFSSHSKCHGAHAKWEKIIGYLDTTVSVAYERNRLNGMDYFSHFGRRGDF